jgi:hypothetical protein
MADQTTPPVDPITGFWRDVWARSAAAGSQMPGMPGMPGGMPMDPSAAAQAFMSPEAMKRMQAAFYDAMAQYAEQYMRTPAFLESMKKSMDQAMQLRQQMDGFLKSNMASAFESATGGSHAEILGAIRQSTAQLQSQIAKIDQRVSDLESAVTGKPKAEKAAPAKKSAKR